MLGGLVAGAASVGAGALADTAQATGPSTAPTRRGRTREYWLQIEHRRHDLAPKKVDPMMGMPITIRTEIDALVFRATRNWGAPLPGSRLRGH